VAVAVDEDLLHELRLQVDAFNILSAVMRHVSTVLRWLTPRTCPMCH
jgi:hypothetical protein